jgi:hypothetical protein
MLRVLASLRWADLREAAAGLVSVVRTLGLGDGLRAIAFATRRHWAAMRRGEGRYRETGKRRIWFKLHYLARVYEYLAEREPGRASQLFEAIVTPPTLAFIGRVIPPSESLSKELVLHRLWPKMIRRDYNIVAEADPPRGNSASLRVRRCYINEVVREVGLMPVADKICGGDFVFWDGYHRNVSFSRTQTLLRGDSLCDHTLTWKDQ